MTAPHIQSPNVKPTTVYHKQALHKGDVWQAKTKSVSPDKPVLSDSAKMQSKGQWIEFIMSDDSGKPKTVKAWVPSLN